MENRLGIEINIPIDLKAFILEGKFDCIQPGQSREWIANNFPAPDNGYDMRSKRSIWKYGSWEFHFDKEQLCLIWCDDLANSHTCPALHMDLWILKELHQLTLGHVLSQLNEAQANYSVKFDRQLKHAAVKVRKSDVVLWFEPKAEEAEIQRPDQQYFLIAIGRSSKESDRYAHNF